MEGSGPAADTDVKLVNSKQIIHVQNLDWCVMMSAIKTDTRPLGPTELYYDKCHDHHNMNVMLALTIHTRAALDTGLVKITLQELQHQFPQLTSRISMSNGKPMFVPMECPMLPLDTDLQCQDMLHQKFDTTSGPLWRVQIITMSELETAGLNFGPEVEAIIEDDSSLETRWRYFLRYLQGRLNQDIDSFEEVKSEEEGRSVVIMTFHPAVTDTTGAFFLAKQFMSILDLLLQSEGPLRLGEPENIPNSIENLLPSTDSSFQLGDIFPMVRAVGNHFIPTRKSPFDSQLKQHKPISDKRVPAHRSRFLRGWLTTAETQELLALCEEDDVTLHGVIMAAGLTAMARLCLNDSSSAPPPNTTMNLRASTTTNLRQFCPLAPKHGCLSAPYEEDYIVPPIIDAADFWRFAHTLTMAHNKAKSDRLPVRQLRLYANVVSTRGGETAFKDMENNRKIGNEMNVSVHGDLGLIFRRESSSPLDSWTKHEADLVQVRLEDVIPMVAAQNMGSPFTHSAHIFQGRLNYVLAYYTSYVDTSQALMLRDETINILRMAVEQ